MAFSFLIFLCIYSSRFCSFCLPFGRLRVFGTLTCLSARCFTASTFSPFEGFSPVLISVTEPLFCSVNFFCGFYSPCNCFGSFGSSCPPGFSFYDVRSPAFFYLLFFLWLFCFPPSGLWSNFCLGFFIHLMTIPLALCFARVFFGFGFGSFFSTSFVLRRILKPDFIFVVMTLSLASTRLLSTSFISSIFVRTCDSPIPTP